MDRGSSTITLIEKDDSASTINQHKPYQKLSCIKKRSCCQFGGITKVFVVYFELLLNNRTINDQLRCLLPTTCEIGRSNQSEKKSELVNRKGIVFHHDDAGPHTSLATRTKLLELGWKVTLHPSIQPRPRTIRLSFI